MDIFNKLPGLVVFWQNGWLVGSDGHGAVSVGLPSQASSERALQWRNLNFWQLDEDGSHSDHSPHSDQAPAAATQGISSLTFSKSSPTLAQVKAKNLLGLVCWLGWVIQWDHLTRSFDCEFAHWLLLASALEFASYLCHQSSYWS